MRLAASALAVSGLAACVPTTKYAYVPATRENFEAAQNGEAIPLVAQSTAICLKDASTLLVRDAAWTDDGICGRARVENPQPHLADVCFAADQLAGVGIPYMSRSASAVPMAAVKVGTCDPAALAAQQVNSKEY